MGDWVALNPDLSLKILTPNRRPQEQEHRLDWTSHVQHPRRQSAMALRGRLENAIRNHFTQNGYLETRTPLLVRSPGMETHIRPFKLESGAYLPTSPEFAMKKLLVGGLEKIFQLSQSFRFEPNSNTHHPEFTMLEFYRAFADDEGLRQDTENLFAALARELFGQASGEESLTYQNQKISLKRPWPRLKVRDLFIEHAQVDLVQQTTAQALREECVRLGLQSDPADTWDDLYFRIWLNLIEPKLPADQAVFVCRYPASQAALSVIDQDQDGSSWAKRFEVYAGGIELGNAFEELTDPEIQRDRFEKDMALRRTIYGDAFPPSPIDEDFLDALTEGMPPAAGIALGVDRMAMLFANEPEIRFLRWLDSVPEGQPKAVPIK